jgi:hypothetical protein
MTVKSLRMIVAHRNQLVGDSSYSFIKNGYRVLSS